MSEPESSSSRTNDMAAGDSSNESFLESCGSSDYDSAESTGTGSSYDVPEGLLVSWPRTDSEDDDNSDDDESEEDENTSLWHEVDDSQLQAFPFTATPGFIYHSSYPENRHDLTPLVVYRRYCDDDFVDKLINEVNSNAVPPPYPTTKGANGRAGSWTPTYRVEMLKFLGVLLYLEHRKLIPMGDFWREEVVGNFNVLPKDTMPLRRFTQILHRIHFIDTTAKVRNQQSLNGVYDLYRDMQNKFSADSTPGEIITLDEHIIPFRRLVNLKTWIRDVRARRGFEIFKLCDGCNGYVYKFWLHSKYSKVDVNDRKALMTHMAQELLHDYVNEGRTFVSDYYVSSLHLAAWLLEKKTNVVGILEEKKQGVPKEIRGAKLQDSQLLAKQSNNGIVVAKWRDKNDDCILFSTKPNGVRLEPTGKKNRRGENVLKPALVNEFMKGKSGFVEISDYEDEYGDSFRKETMWHQKVVLDLIVRTMLKNAWVVYNHLKNDEKPLLKLRRFRLAVLQALCKTE